MRIFGILFIALSGAGCGGRIDGDTTGSGSSKATGGPGDPSGGSGPATSRPACALATPLHANFDDGFPTGWGAAPGGLQLDSTSPISGSQSLKIDIARALLYRALLTTQVQPACAATLKLAIRIAPPLFSTGETATIARLSASPGFFDLVVGPDGVVSIVEVDAGQAGATTGGGPPTGPRPAPSAGNAHVMGSIAANVSTAIVVTLDLAANLMRGSVSPLDAPASSGSPSPLVIAHGNLTGLLIGLFTTSATSGTYWLDDVSLE